MVVFCDLPSEACAKECQRPKKTTNNNPHNARLPPPGSRCSTGRGLYLGAAGARMKDSRQKTLNYEVGLDVPRNSNEYPAIQALNDGQLLALLDLTQDVVVNGHVGR